jgi:hypothetical protein
MTPVLLRARPSLAQVLVATSSSEDEGRERVRKLLLVITCAVAATAGPLGAEDGEEKKESGESAKWYDRLSVGGDFRLRYEGFDWSGHFDDGQRDRFRYRLRVGLEARVLDNLGFGLQLRSGNPQNPISDNQSFDGGLDKARISIAEAYVDWQATDALSIVAGKFSPEKLWTAADMEWDDDVVAEGAMEVFAWKPGGFVRKLSLGAYQYVLDESGDSVDAYMFGGQIVPTFDLGASNGVSLGATFEAVSHPERVAALYYKQELVIDSEHVTNLLDPATGSLVSDFRVGSLSAEWKNTRFERWPVKVSLFLYKNFGARDTLGVILPVGSDKDPLAFARGSDNDTAWFGRIQLGDYKRPGHVALRLARYDSKPDALFFAYAQSDTRRSSNVDGYRTDLRIGMPRDGYVNATWYHTNWTIGSDSTMDRWQLDYILKF